MIEAALRYLNERFEKATAPDQVTLADGSTLVLKPGQDEPVSRLAFQPPRIAYEFADLEDFRRFVGAGPQRIGFVERDGIVAYLDREDRRDVVRLPFRPTTAFALLQRLAEGPQWMDQRAFLQMLRFDLRGVLAGDKLIPAVERVRFERRDDADSVVRHGDESIGKSVAAKLSQAAAMPEEVELAGELWHGVPSRFFIDAAVMVDPAGAKFALRPYPDDLEDAVADHLRRLVAADPGIYFAGRGDARMRGARP